jgi:hypothetical protein
MCNINAIIKPKKDKKEYTTFITTTTSISYSENQHSEGYYQNHTKKITKNTKKLNTTKQKHTINKSTINLYHERITTSGNNNKENQQPIKK